MVLPMFISVDSYVVPFLWCLMRSGTQLCLLMFARRVLCSCWWLRVQLRRGCHQGFRAPVVCDWSSIRGVTWLQLLMRARRLRCCAIDCQRFHDRGGHYMIVLALELAISSELTCRNVYQLLVL